jgi:glycosyltransferase involved in cell wall biosynthesis
MAAGLAFAGTDIEGIRIVAGPENRLFLAPPGDDEGLATAILRLANDSDLRVTIGELNRIRVRERFSAARMCEASVAVLNEIVSANQ